MNKQITTSGEYYKSKLKENNYSPDLQSCIKGMVSDLINNETTNDKPAMLLGKVQAGKTFAYAGIISLALDNGYDVIVVLTKGTKFLLTQTYLRMRKEFSHFIDQGKIHVFDVMQSSLLTGYLVQKKLIIVSKKEDDNLRRLLSLFSNEKLLLYKKRTLIVDDEADFASVGFQKNKESGISVNTITQQISDLRKVIHASDYLQVTATPYSLYLQPDNYKPTNLELRPNKPAFTYVVPIHNKYIGSDHFYGDLSVSEDPVYSNMFGPLISPDELNILNKIDSIKLYNDVNYTQYYLSSNGIPSLWSGLLRFIIGTCIRRWQSEKTKKPIKKYAFIIHTNTRKNIHEWQFKLVNNCLSNFKKIALEHGVFFEKFVEIFIEEFTPSMNALNLPIPSSMIIFKDLIRHLKEDYVGLYQVNSNHDAENLLSETTGQIQLLNPMNIFIGGFIFDRGVTIDNLIGFYYGRNPRTFQQDTVVQHQRIFGARDPKDLAVTRLYTSLFIYSVLRKIHEFDNALWNAIKINGVDAPIQFIRRMKNTIRPCSPNKLMLSKVQTITPGKRILPIGFHPIGTSSLKRVTGRVDIWIKNIGLNDESIESVKVKLDEIQPIISLIWGTYFFEKGFRLSVDQFQACLSYLSKLTSDEENFETVNVIFRDNREISRIRKSTGRFEDVPDTASGEKSELRVARRVSKENPTILLLRQNGKKENGWTGIPFYWIVLVAQTNTKTVVFSEEIEK